MSSERGEAFAPGDLFWSREEKPVWDADKARVIGAAPDGAFVLPFKDGEELPGEWWSVRVGDDGTIAGYGRLDIGWGGDAEILLAVDPDRQERGVGSFALTRLEQEAAARDINYVYNTIREHDRRDLVHDWLIVRGFRGPVDGDLRKRVEVKGETGRTPDATAFTPDGDADLGPGREEAGGYVDVDEHQY